MADLVWIHEDALRQSHPVFAAAAPGSPAVFIWDNASLEARHIGPKRRLFIYQTLAGMEIDIIAGTAVLVIPALIAQHGVTRLLVPGTPNPAFHAQLSDVRRACPGQARRTSDNCCLLYTSPSPRDRTRSRMPSSA